MLRTFSNTQKTLLFLTTSILLSFSLVTFDYFPYFGFALSLTIINSLVYLFKNKRTRTDVVYYILSLIFNFFLILRSNTFLTFLNVNASLFLCSYMVNEFNALKKMTHAVLAPVAVFFNTLTTRNEYKASFKQIKSKLKIKSDFSFSHAFSSVTIALLCLIIVVPLLASANPIFENMVTNFFKFINLGKILKAIFGENFAIFFCRFTFFVAFAYFLPRLISLTNKVPSIFAKIKNAIVNKKSNLKLAKTIISFVLAAFLVSQVQFYLSSEEALRSMGYTHSDHVREVFGQLTVVSLIIFSLIYKDKSRDKYSKTNTYFLIIESFLLTLAALKSDIDYSSTFGFTHKRLYGFAVVFLTFGALLLFSIKYIANLNKKFLIKNLVYLTSGILIAINILNFDYLIYHYAKARTGEGTDHLYLSKLSSDTHARDEQYKQLDNKVGYSLRNVKDYKTRTAYTGLKRSLSQTTNKYSKFQWQTFNISDYREYLRINNQEFKTNLNSWRW